MHNSEASAQRPNLNTILQRIVICIGILSAATRAQAGDALAVESGAAIGHGVFVPQAMERYLRKLQQIDKRLTELDLEYGKMLVDSEQEKDPVKWNKLLEKMGNNRSNYHKLIQQGLLINDWMQTGGGVLVINEAPKTNSLPA